MNISKSQQGFSVIAVLLLVVIVGLVGLIGWRVYDTQQATKPSNLQATSEQTQTAEAPIQNKQDVEAVQKELDAASVDSDLDSSALDSDLDSLL